MNLRCPGYRRWDLILFEKITDPSKTNQVINDRIWNTRPHGIKRPVNFKNFWPTLSCTENSVNFTVESPVSCISKKQKQFIIQPIKDQYLSLKVVFRQKKPCTVCSGALLKKRKRFLLNFLNRSRYPKNCNRFEFNVLRAVNFKKKIWWKICSHC